MRSKKPFAIIYAPEVKQHLQHIERKYYSLIRTEIENQLPFEPNVETRNRKPLRRPITLEAEWELRCGPENRFRVFYQISMEQSEVYILAIGVKNRNQLWIGGESVTL